MGGGRVLPHHPFPFVFLQKRNLPYAVPYGRGESPFQNANWVWVLKKRRAPPGPPPWWGGGQQHYLLKQKHGGAVNRSLGRKAGWKVPSCCPETQTLRLLHLQHEDGGGPGGGDGDAGGAAQLEPRAGGGTAGTGGGSDKFVLTTQNSDL